VFTWKLLVNMTQVSDMAPGPLFFFLKSGKYGYVWWSGNFANLYLYKICVLIYLSKMTLRDLSPKEIKLTFSNVCSEWHWPLVNDLEWTLSEIKLRYKFAWYTIVNNCLKAYYLSYILTITFCMCQKCGKMNYCMQLKITTSTNTLNMVIITK
jgi:hypothetical protein